MRFREPHVSLIFERKIVYFDQGMPMDSNWTGDKFTMKNNLYFDTRGSGTRFAGKSVEEWQAGGQDKDSAIADTLFVNARNFEFRPGSRAPVICSK